MAAASIRTVRKPQTSAVVAYCGILSVLYQWLMMVGALSENSWAGHRQHIPLTLTAAVQSILLHKRFDNRLFNVRASAQHLFVY
jgi:hypothetical protein